MLIKCYVVERGGRTDVAVLSEDISATTPLNSHNQSLNDGEDLLVF